MWTILIIYLFLLSIYLSIKLKFKNYKINIKELLKKDKTSLFLTLGTKIGVGSIIGTVSSIIIGGFSSVIWMILFSILFTSIIYYESYYGNKYKKVNNSESVGGPYFIIRYGLNNTQEYTQKEVANMLGISQSYISRIEKKVIKRLKSIMRT